MSFYLIVVAAASAAAALAWWRKRASPLADVGAVGAVGAVVPSLQPHPAGAWGPGWGPVRPPPLPEDARRPSAPGSALPLIAEAAEVVGLGPAFGAAVADLARTESGAILGLPARRPYPATAGWGVYQFNVPAWQALRGRSIGGRIPPVELPGDLPDMMWDASPAQEVLAPVERYAQVWRHTMAIPGATPSAGLAAVRIYHRGPAYLPRFWGALPGGLDAGLAAVAAHGSDFAAAVAQRTGRDVRRMAGALS